ncbi:MAG: hypothetical protein H6860_02070 [Rhodospirillales bacterium]|nr:hypothetical protein [Rhodospirillales bacterium]
MAGRILLCSECGTKNRIPEEKPKGNAVCGNCGKQLAIKGSRGSFLSLLFAIIVKLWFVWVLGFIFVVLPYLEDSGSKSPSRASSTYQTAKVEKPAFTAPPVQITHGIVSKNFTSGVAPLEIKTGAGNNYYIKIVNVANNQVALTAYIVGGRPFEVLMPLGTYEIRYAAGNTWYGTQHYFGPDTAFSKANEVFHFTFDGYQYSGYTVELILQAYGNLRTVHIDEAEF